MCRIVSYLGPPIRLSALLSGPPHGLVRQAHAPRRMTCGTINADGWGVGWFEPGGVTRPGVVRGVLPIWSDPNVDGISHAIASGSIVAAVRAASPGLATAIANTAPYVLGDRLLVHNGRIWPWHGEMSRALRDSVDPADEGSVRGTTDSEWLGALWMSEIRRGPPGDEAAALRAAISRVTASARRLDGGFTASLVIAGRDGHLAVRFGEPGPAPSLFVASDARRWPGGTLIASEPLEDDEADWREIPPSTLVRIDAEGVRFEALGPTRED